MRLPLRPVSAIELGLLGPGCPGLGGLSLEVTARHCCRWHRPAAQGAAIPAEYTIRHGAYVAEGMAEWSLQGASGRHIPQPVWEHL